MAEEKSLRGFSSKYFSLFTDKNGNEWIHFFLDASEPGHSKNTKYARSELRHTENWTLSKKRRLSYTFKAFAAKENSSYTVGQIHILPDDSVLKNEKSPLLRVEIVKNQLRAKIKDYKTGKYETFLLGPYKNGDEKTVSIETDEKNISVYIDGEKFFTKEVFCPLKNYLKVGLYPQENKGLFEMFVKNLSVEIDSTLANPIIAKIKSLDSL